jgi:hypothetical protein
MPKQWERSLTNIPRLAEPDELWREARGRGTRERLPDPTPPRRQRLVAGVVAMGVFLAAALFAWQMFERAGTRHSVGEATETTPPDARPSYGSLTLERPAPDAAFPIPTATLEFRDFVAQLKPTGTSFIRPFYATSELPGSSLGVPAGLPLRMAGDAEAATVKIYASPPFERHPIATYDLTEGPALLPDRPGTYYLVVRAEWTDGWASYLWGIPVLRPGTLQFVLDDHRRNQQGTADLWVDGRRVQGAVVRRTLTEGASTTESPYPQVDFDDDSYVPVEAGAPVQVLGAPAELSAALTGPSWADASTPGSGVSLFGPRAQVPAEPGHHLLVLDASWQEGALGPTGNGYREEIWFAFPLDVGANSVPSSEPLPSGPIVVTFDASEAGKIPRALATFGGREYPAVMNGYRFTIDGEVFESSNQYRDAGMIGAATIVVPPGALIEFDGDQDGVLVGWGDGDLAAAPASLSVQGSPGEAVVLRFRGEWGRDSFVEWELFLELQAA